MFGVHWENPITFEMSYDRALDGSYSMSINPLILPQPDYFVDSSVP
jgi:hypothetical protein